jgi:GTP-binding protein Era
VIDAYSKLLDFEAVVPISAKTGDGIDRLLSEQMKHLKPSAHFFADDEVTDQADSQVLTELIREKMLRLLDKEIPHGIAIGLERFFERDTVNGEPIIEAEAIIYCEKDSHKGIIIGKQGAMLKKISSMARADCEKFMGTRVYLTTWVKVKENWRDSDFLVRNFGYRE